MKGWTLVLETAGPSCQVGLLKEGEPVGGIRWDWPLQHAERLIVLVQQVLEQVGLTWREIGQVIYHQGPGSHTGLRIGLAAVKAWALSLGWAVYPVPLMRVLWHIGRGVAEPSQPIFTFWASRPGQWYGQFWRGGTPEEEATVAEASQWLKRLTPATLWVGNVGIPTQIGVYMPEVSWREVGRAAEGIAPLTAPEEIGALIPLYFRPFVPTTRRA